MIIRPEGSPSCAPAVSACLPQAERHPTQNAAAADAAHAAGPAERLRAAPRSLLAARTGGSAPRCNPWARSLPACRSGVRCTWPQQARSASRAGARTPARAEQGGLTCCGLRARRLSVGCRPGELARSAAMPGRRRAGWAGQGLTQRRIPVADVGRGVVLHGVDCAGRMCQRLVSADPAGGCQQLRLCRRRPHQRRPGSPCPSSPAASARQVPSGPCQRVDKRHCLGSHCLQRAACRASQRLSGQPPCSAGKCRITAANSPWQGLSVHRRQLQVRLRPGVVYSAGSGYASDRLKFARSACTQGAGWVSA